MCRYPLISDIYDCAVNPDRWESVLDRAVEYVGASGGIVLTIPTSDASSTWSLNIPSRVWREVPAEKMAYMQETFFEYEREAWQSLMQLEPLEIQPDNKAYADSTGLDSRDDYLYLKENVGILRKVGIRLNSELGKFHAVAFQFDKKFENLLPSHVDAVKQLSPHFAKTIELSHMFDALRARYQMVLSALDHVDIGLCVLDSSANVIVANEEANRIFSDSGVVSLRQRKIQCSQADKADLLKQHVSRAILTGGVLSAPVDQVVVLNEADREPVFFHATHLQDSQAELGYKLEGVLLTVVDLSKTAKYNVDHFAAIYRLTAAESEVCTYLLQGLSNNDIAEQRNLSTQTIKSQVRSIYAKAKVTTRVDLVRLILKITPPISD